MEDLQTGRKSTPPKGEKPPPPPAPGAKRRTQGDATPAPKKRKSAGPSRPKVYPDVQDPEDDMDASKPIAERLRNSPKLSPSKPPTKLGKGKGKGKGRGKGQGEKPAAARSLDKESTDDQTTPAPAAAATSSRCSRAIPLSGRPRGSRCFKTQRTRQSGWTPIPRS